MRFEVQINPSNFRFGTSKKLARPLNFWHFDPSKRQTLGYLKKRKNCYFCMLMVNKVKPLDVGASFYSFLGTYVINIQCFSVF